MASDSNQEIQTVKYSTEELEDFASTEATGPPPEVRRSSLIKGYWQVTFSALVSAIFFLLLYRMLIFGMSDTTYLKKIHLLPKKLETQCTPAFDRRK